MSKIGKINIMIPDKVKVALAGNILNIEGPLGKKSIDIDLDTFNLDIKAGDIVVIHQNVFRTFYDMKGKKKKSRSFFKDNLYFCALDQIYLYKNSNGWNSFGDRCFIKPIKSKDDLTLDKEASLIGILKYGNSSLNKLKINPGDLVGYTPNGEWEFLIEKERLYCMKSNDIVIKYEHEGNEVEYNPSWANSS